MPAFSDTNAYDLLHSLSHLAQGGGAALLDLAKALLLVALARQLPAAVTAASAWLAHRAGGDDRPQEDS